MLLSTYFSRGIFVLTGILFGIIEIIILLSVILTFNKELKKNQDEIISTVNSTGRELGISFNSILETTLVNYKSDLFMIGKKLNIYYNTLLNNSTDLKYKSSSKFLSRFSYSSIEDSCIISKKNKVTVDPLITNQSEPIYSIVKNLGYLDSNKPINHQKIINELSNLPLLDKFSYYHEVNDIGDDYFSPDNASIICYLRESFRSILIKNFLMETKTLFLNNFYIFIDDTVYQYPPNNTTYTSVNKIGIVNTTCSKYNNSCILTTVGYTMGSVFKLNLTDFTHIHYFHLMGFDLFLLTCLRFHITSPQNFNFICLENNYNRYINNLIKNQVYNNTEFLIISVRFGSIKLYFNINNKTMDNYETICNSNKFKNLPDDCDFFYTIFSDIFDHKMVDQKTINKLINQFDEIKSIIIDKTGNEGSQTIIIPDQYFLDYEYNSSGHKDYKYGEIKRDKACYILTPITERNKSYFLDLTLDKSDNTSAILMHSLLIIRLKTKTSTQNLLSIVIFRNLKMWAFFSFLIVIIIVLFSIFFTKFLDSLFIPIGDILRILMEKLLLQMDRSNEVTVHRVYSISEISSNTPELAEFIKLFKFLDNINNMKKLIKSNSKTSIDFDLLNEIFPELKSNREIIKYGYFIASFYYQKNNLDDCFIAIKRIKSNLEYEKIKLKGQKENLKIEILNLISNFPYVNEFLNVKSKIDSNDSVVDYYYELIIITEKCYFMYAICFLKTCKIIKKELKEITILLHQIKKEKNRKNKEKTIIKEINNNINNDINKEKNNEISTSTINNKDINTNNNINNLNQNNNSNNVNNNNNQDTNNNNEKINANNNNVEADKEIEDKQNILDMNYGENLEHHKEELKLEIEKSYQKAIKYFKKALEINTLYSINKIKSIVILIYLTKCYLSNNQENEAIEKIKQSLISLFDLNQYLIELNKTTKINPRIMLLINDVIMEQLLFYIAKVNLKKKNKELSIKLLINCIGISFYKTDNIQSKAAKNLYNIFYEQLIKDRKYINAQKYKAKNELMKIEKKDKKDKKDEKDLISSSNQNIKKTDSKIFNTFVGVVKQSIQKELKEINLNNIIKKYDNELDNVNKKVTKIYYFNKIYNRLRKIDNQNNDENELINNVNILENEDNNDDTISNATDIFDSINYVNKKNPNNRKNIIIFFSPIFIKLLPSKIEICEVISKSIKGYMNDEDEIFCARFDSCEVVKMKKVKDFSKDHLMQILTKKVDVIPEYINDYYGMQVAFYDCIVKLGNKSNDKDQENLLKNKDNYIFQFILSNDYTFNDIKQNEEFKKLLKDYKFSLYTFVFDTIILNKKINSECNKIKDEDEVNKCKKSKKHKIIHNLKQIDEGVLISVDNFKIIKLAFQNISGKYVPGNIFKLNNTISDNIFYDYNN